MLQRFKKQFQRDGEICLRIKVRPNASKTRVKDILSDGTIKIDVAAVPEKGKANREVVKFLAREFEVEKSNISIISGKSESLKLVRITR